MSFKEAEATEAALSGLAATLRDSLAEPDYMRNPYQVYENMDSDPLISIVPEFGKPACRVALLRRVATHRTDPTTIPTEVVSFCRDNLQAGPLVPPSDSASLGRVQSVRSLANALADSDDILTLKDAMALVRDLAAATSDAALTLAKQRAALAGKGLSRFQMWSYNVADPTRPRQELGTTREQACNILGLGYFVHHAPKDELAHWVHTLPPSINARRPTAWDACADKGNVYWRPGGRTFRLDRDDYGLPEVVHDPITGSSLTVAIEVLI